MTAMIDRGMTAEIGPGERANRARIRRRNWTFGLLFAAGLPIGFFAALLEEGDLSGMLTGNLPPWFAIAASVVYIVAVTAGSVARQRQMDELDRHDSLMAGAVGGNLVLLVYPVWFLLWKGTLAGAPPHWMPFAVAFFGSMLTYGFLKLRGARA